MFISRQVNENLAENMWSIHGMTEMPRQRFFKPTPIFWDNLKDIMAKHNLKMLIDCGTGNGELPKEASEQGIKMGGCDTIRREGNDPCEVQIVPAHKMPFNNEIWPIVCRPDHSGWATALLEKALSEGHGFIYVGLEENLEIDQLRRYNESYRYTGQGEDREVMLVFEP